MNNSRLSTKKLALIVVASVIALALLQWLIGYLTTGKIVITTDSKYNDVTISSVSHSTTASEGFSKHAKGSLTTKLKRGGYFVSVQNGVDGSNQYVKVRGHSTTRLKINLPKTTGVEPVAYTAAQNLIANSSNLKYLNPDRGYISELNNQDKQASIAIGYGLKSIKWADTSYGIGQNASGELFVIDNSSVKPLKSPISNMASDSAVYSVSSDRKIYIGLGSSIYTGYEKKGFKKIYDEMPARSFLVAGLKGVAILTDGYTGNHPRAVTIDNGGAKHSKNLDGFLNGWSSWSKDGKYLMIVEGAKGNVFDMSLHQIATIPQSNITYADWSSSDTLFYNVGSQLWSYNIRQQKSQLVANMPLNSDIKEISVSTDSAYVYLVTQSGASDSSNQTIRRVGLKSQKSPDYIYKLQSVLPLDMHEYSINLINFSGPPTILVQSYSSTSSYTQQAISELQSLGFDTSKFTFQSSQPQGIE